MPPSLPTHTKTSLPSSLSTQTVLAGMTRIDCTQVYHTEKRPTCALLAAIAPVQAALAAHLVVSTLSEEALRLMQPDLGLAAGLGPHWELAMAWQLAQKMLSKPEWKQRWQACVVGRVLRLVLTWRLLWASNLHRIKS